MDTGTSALNLTKYELLSILANKTLDESYDKMMINRKCIIIRPTGFGKTYVMSRMTKKFKKVLFLYPLNIIKIEVLQKYKKELNKNTVYSTYMNITRKFQTNREELLEWISQFDLIICDEAHMTGAEKTYEAIKEIMDYCKDTYFLGATATPDRSDSVDIVDKLFDGMVISEYTMHDAVQDGLIAKPYYVYSLYETANIFDEVKCEALNCADLNKRQAVLNEISAREAEMSNMLNASDVIKKNIDNVYASIDYMKFIVFFSDKKSLELKYEEVAVWFAEAYPNMAVRTLTITSDLEFAKNVDKLSTLKSTKNTIDLVFCIDMLNMGYHINNLTGIVMLRGTHSDIIFKQQIGRCLSVDSDITPIIFDFVNNLYRKPYFCMNSEKAKDNINNIKNNFNNNRLNDLREMDLIVNDNVAPYQTVINRLMHCLYSGKIEDAIMMYTKNSMPMKKLVKYAGIPEYKLRQELIKHGVILED